jgi:hypothetical protein
MTFKNLYPTHNTASILAQLEPSKLPNPFLLPFLMKRSPENLWRHGENTHITVDIEQSQQTPQIATKF